MENLNNIDNFKEYFETRFKPVSADVAILYDDQGRRIAKCVCCGITNITDEFIFYGGSGESANEGICYSCAKLNLRSRER